MKPKCVIYAQRLTVWIKAFRLFKNKFKFFMYKKYGILLLLIFGLGILGSSCNRHGCPGIDKNTGEFKVNKKAKTKSGLLPKGKKRRK